LEFLINKRVVMLKKSKRIITADANVSELAFQNFQPDLKTVNVFFSNDVPKAN